MVHGSREMYEQFTHLIVEAKSKFSPNLKPYRDTHEIMDFIEAFHQISFDYFTIPPVKIKTKPVLYLLKRKENYKHVIPDLSINEEDTLEVETEENDTSESITVSNADVTKVSRKLNLETLRRELHESYEDSGDIINDQVGASSNKESLTPQVMDNEKNSEKRITSRKYEIRHEKMEVQSKEKRSIKDSIKKIKEQDIRRGKNGLKRTVASVEKGRVREKIKNIINQFKDENLARSSEEKPKGTKDKIKEIIENEKRKLLEQEELMNLQNQILTIIETNPNIINKNSIKDKIDNLFSKELPIVNSKETVTKTKLNKPIERRKLVKGDVQSTENVLVENSYEEIEYKENDEEVEDDSVHDENALDFYEELNPNEDVDYAGAIDSFDYDEVRKYTPLEAEFQAASEHLENIMMMIEDIVSTMEVEEETYDDEDD